MALKAVLKSLDGLEESITRLYKKDGEEYRLEVEGMVQKATLDEFRDTNIALKKSNEDLAAKLKQYDGIDVAKVKELQETERKVRDGELIKAGKLDELKAGWLDPIKTEFQSKIDKAEKERQELAAQLEVLTIDNRLAEIGNKKGLRPTAMEDFIARGRKIFKLKEGRPVALAPDGTLATDKSGNVFTMETWTEAQGIEAPHLFQPSNGGGTPPGGPKLPPGAKFMTRTEFDKLDSDTKHNYLIVQKGKITD